MLPNIHILGIQGSGKGTQSELLVNKYHLTYLASGNLFRARAEKDDAFGREVAAQLRTGFLLPDSSLEHTLREYLDTQKIERGLLGDGVIRTIDQYHLLEPLWHEHDLDEPLLVHLMLSEATAKARIENRQAEQEQGKNIEHNLIYGGKLLKRTDDNPLAISRRFAMFHSMTKPVITLLESKKRCIHVEADAPIEKVHQEICKQIEAFYPQLTHGSY